MTSTKLFLSDRGEGAPVLLLHSGGMSSRQWRLLADVLSARWRVLAPDFLGCGANPPFEDDATFDVRREVGAVLGSLPEAGPMHVVGHSYGALLGVKIALAKPGLVRSLSLYEPPAFGILYDEPADREAIAELASLEQSPIFDDEERGGSEAWMRLFVDWWNGPGAWDRMPEPGRAAFVKVGRKVYREVRSITADRTSAQAYASLTVPALLMSGARSPVPERRVMARLAKAISGASLVTFESAGHLGPLTHAAEVNEAIARHLASVG